MKKRLFITSLSGLVGQQVQSRLALPDSSWERLPAAWPDELTNPHSLTKLLSPLPDAVIHLAGQTFASKASRNPIRTLEINLLTFDLLQAPKMRGDAGTFLYSSFVDVYGQDGAYLAKSKSTFIAASHKHRQENPRVIDLPIIEMQGGEYRGEDNIVRFENQYSRTL